MAFEKNLNWLKTIRIIYRKNLENKKKIWGYSACKGSQKKVKFLKFTTGTVQYIFYADFQKFPSIPKFAWSRDYLCGLVLDPVEW